MLIIENNVRVRHGRKWKERWVVMKKLSPVANSPSLILYKDSTKTQEKSTILLDNYYGVWEGCGLVEGEEHLLSIISLKPLLLAFYSELTLRSWKNKITNCLGSSSLFQVSFSDDGLPVRRRSDSRKHLSPSAREQHHLFITTQHVTITTLYPPLDHICSWHFPDIKNIVCLTNSKVRFTIDHRKTGFYCVSVNTPQAKGLHEELLKNFENFWKTRKSPKHLNFPIQATSLSTTASDFMFSVPLYRQLVQPNLRKLSIPLKSRFMKARNSSFQGSEEEPRDGLMRHHSDYNLPSNASFRKLSQPLIRKAHHSSDEVQDNDTTDRLNSNGVRDNMAAFNITPNGSVSNHCMSSSALSNGSVSNEAFANGITRVRNNGVGRESRSSTHSPHLPRDFEKAHFPPKRYSLGRLKPPRADTYSANTAFVREKMAYEEPMAQSLLEDSSGEMNENSTTSFPTTNFSDVSHFPTTSNSICFPAGQLFDPHRPLPYTDLSRYDGDSINESHTWGNANRFKQTPMSLSDTFHFPIHQEHHANNTRDRHQEDYLQPLPTKGMLLEGGSEPQRAPPPPQVLHEPGVEASNKLASTSQHLISHSKPSENYISIEQIDRNYPMHKTTTSSTDHGSSPFIDSEAFSNHASSMEDSVFLSNDPFDRRDKPLEDDGYTRMNRAANTDIQTSVKNIHLSNVYNDDPGDLSSSTSPIQPHLPSGIRSQHYINIYSPPPIPPPLPPKSSQKHLHARSGSSDQGRIKKDLENHHHHHHPKPPLPRRSNYPFNNSSQHASYPFPSPLNKTTNRPFSAKSHSLKHRKPDLTIDTGAHLDTGLEATAARRTHDGKFSNVVYSGGKVKDVFDSISLRSTPQDMHQSSPSLATSKPRTGQEYINRCYLNDSQSSPMRGTAFTFDDKPPSSVGYDENSPLTPSTSSLKSPIVSKPELLTKQQHTPSINPRAKQFFFPSCDDSEKKLNYADIDMIDASVTTTTPVLTDQTVYATIDYLATKAVSNVSKLHARQREGSLDKQTEVSSLNMGDAAGIERRRLSLESRKISQ